MATKTRIFISGGSGMVGKNILSCCQDDSLDFFVPSHKELDLEDYYVTKKYLKNLSPDFVIHCAGKVGGIQANVRSQSEFLTENIRMGTNIILASRDCGIKQLINLGSSCMYPRNQESKLTEEQIFRGELEPTNEGYAMAKIVVAKLCQYISNSGEGFHYKTIVPCNLYGEFDKFEPDRSHLIPAIIHKIYKAQQRNSTAVEIWGDGQAKREFMYAGDLADFILEAIKRFDTLPQITNVGIGEDHTINDYYKIIAKVLGYEGTFQYNLNRPTGMSRKLLDISKQLKFGWTAKTSLLEGINKTYSYFKAIQP